MRIGLLAPVWFPVPPTGYGGIEWIVSILADGLVEAGHDVTLVASGGSRTRARLVSVLDPAPSERIGEALPDLAHVLAGYELAAAGEFDLVNDHSGLVGAALSGTVSTPVVHTVHGPLDGDAAPVYRTLAHTAPGLRYISLSLNQRRPIPELAWIANCPNALGLETYPFSSGRGDYLLFLGRMGYDKGAHRAIAVAEEAGLPLRIAGKCREPLERQFFELEVRPHLGPSIEYLGEVGHEEKVALLQGAYATLFPIDWEEPFGLVMIESMACGTPVIATRCGAVPEVIEDGVTGVLVDDASEMGAALGRADAIDVVACRRYVEERFSAARMVRDYVAAYELVLTRDGA